MSSTAATPTTAHESLYTLIEGLKDDGHMTDGAYLSAMNALQAIYAMIPHPASAPAPMTPSAPPEYLAAWNRLFERPLPSYRMSHLLYSHDGPLNSGWMTEYTMITKLDLWAAVIRETGSPAISVVDYLQNTIYSEPPTIEQIRHLRLYGFREAMVNYYFCSDKKICRSILKASLFDCAEKATDSIKAFNAAPSLTDAISMYLAQAWGCGKANLLIRHVAVGRGLSKMYAPWSVPSTGYHRISVAMEGMPVFEAYTPAIQLPRTDIVYRLRMLRFVFLSSKYGTKGTDAEAFSKEFVRHLQWRKSMEKLDTSLSISGITAATRTQRRTYEVMVRSELGDRHFATITYLDPLSTGTV
jgi:hypothetical protein